MLTMAVDEATEVLIILIIIIAVIFIFLIVIIVLFALRWRRNQFHSLTYSYSNPSRYRSWSSTRHSKQERNSPLYAYASPTDVFALTELSGRDIDTCNDKLFETEEGETNIYDLPRISAISGTSVDIGDVGDVSTFVREPRVVQVRHKQADRGRVDSKVDSMRSSAGVDLGANYNKAWNIIGRPQRLDL